MPSIRLHLAPLLCYIDRVMHPIVRLVGVLKSSFAIKIVNLAIRIHFAIRSHLVSDSKNKKTYRQAIALMNPDACERCS